MIYTNVKKIKEAKKLNIKSMLSDIKKSSILFIDTETFAKDYVKESVIEDFIASQIAEGKKITAATRKSAEKHALDVQKERALDSYQSGVRLFQIATVTNNIYVIDTFETSKQDLDLIITSISNKCLCGQNLKFDLKVITVNYPKFVPGDLFDTMIAYRIIKGYTQVEYAPSHLANVVKYHTGVVLMKGHGGDDWSLPIDDEQFNYAVDDVKYLKQVYESQVNELQKSSVHQVNTGYFNNELYDTVSIIEMKFIKVLVAAELHGIPINIPGLKKRLDESEKELKDIRAVFDAKNVNTSSPKQLLEFLESEIPDVDILSTSKQVLVKHANYKIVDTLLRVKKLQKEVQMITDYLYKWPKNGIIYPSFNQLKATTGRMSCYDPNVQQIPRSLKKMFYKSTKQNPAFRIDYPSMEARTGGCVMNDKTIIDIFQHNRDMHVVTASLFLNKKESEVTKDERFKAKAANFGFLFGMGAKTYVSYAYQNYGLQIDLEESFNTRNKYMKIYKGVKAFHDKNSALLSQHREIITTSLLGRKMLVDTFTNANNYPVQSSAIDILKLAAVIFYNRTKAKKLNATIVNIVHDELVVISDKKSYAKAKIELKDSMETAANFAMPQFKTECELEELSN